MPSANEPSIEELREESERNREALAATVGELRERVGETAAELKTMVSPAHIKQEIKDYIQQERETLVESVRRKARENPLQAAAIGAAVAFPALGLLRALPAPLWLIGAGLFLTSKRGQATARDLKSQADAAVQQGREKASDFASSIQSDLQDRVAGARYAVEDAQSAVTSAVGGVADKARQAFHEARDAITGVAENTASGAKATVGDLSASAGQKAQSAKEDVARIATSSRKNVVDFVNENALLVAGVGVAVGAFIAASIPSSDAESKLFGAGSEKLKDKAREVAAQGIEKAGDFAAEAAGAVAAAAAREGLDASGVQGALNKVADGVRAVADRGVDTALGKSDSRSSPDLTQQAMTERNAS